MNERSIPTLCIPRANGHVSEKQIRTILGDLELGVIDRVDISTKTNDKGEKTNRIFIYFKHWYDTENGVMARERLMSGKDVKIMYDGPWFWKVYIKRTQYWKN
jgi:hypothetical protein